MANSAYSFPIDERMAAALEREGIVAPLRSRLPTQAELMRVVESLGCDVERQQDRESSETGKWFEFHATDQEGNWAEVCVNRPGSGKSGFIAFRRPYCELPYRITHGLAQLLGPFVMMSDSAGQLVIVTPESTIRAIEDAVGDEFHTAKPR